MFTQIFRFPFEGQNHESVMSARGPQVSPMERGDLFDTTKTPRARMRLIKRLSQERSI